MLYLLRCLLVVCSCSGEPLLVHQLESCLLNSRILVLVLVLTSVILVDSLHCGALRSTIGVVLVQRRRLPMDETVNEIRNLS